MTLKTFVSIAGWSAALRNEFAAVKFGQSVQVPVYVTKGTGQGAVTLKATSERANFSSEPRPVRRRRSTAATSANAA